jgi:hypothetical protein
MSVIATYRVPRNRGYVGPEAFLAELVEADLKKEMLALDELLGDTRARYHKRLTPFASSENLIALDGEIRAARVNPPSPELQLEVRRLTARLRALDPH